MTKLIITLLAVMATASLVQAGETGNALLGRTIGVTCSGCHGPEGESIGEAPSLKGLPSGTIAKRLREFKSGTRPASIMDRIAKGYTDAEIDAVADYFATLK